MEEATPKRLLVLGNSKVGKTSLLQQYVNNAFNPAYTQTMGMETLTKTANVGSPPSPLPFEFFDTAGGGPQSGRCGGRGASARSNTLMFLLCRNRRGHKIQDSVYGVLQR